MEKLTTICCDCCSHFRTFSAKKGRLDVPQNVSAKQATLFHGNFATRRHVHVQSRIAQSLWRRSTYFPATTILVIWQVTEPRAKNLVMQTPFRIHRNSRNRCDPTALSIMCVSRLTSLFRIASIFAHRLHTSTQSATPGGRRGKAPPSCTENSPSEILHNRPS